MSSFSVLPDESNSVSDIYELTEWLIRNEFLPSAKDFYESQRPDKSKSAFTSFLSGILYGAHLVWNTVTGDKFNAVQVLEVSRVIAILADYKPDAEWEKHFEAIMKDAMQAIRLDADQEGENEQIEKA